ncbi:MAG: phosphomannomutase/phosphoglucomutase [Caldisericum sp.]|uniref:phosphomannomutase/phosphoglucomutase n=1 Tax=Caldisericum sp. TaxID=2499687 RepID=UPI003D13A4E4
MNIDNTIFRMYDIRGEVDKNLTEEVVNAIGRSYAIYLKDKFKKKNLTVSVGRDIRLHSERLENALISGILSEGVQVIDIGVCPTPVLYFSLFNLPVDGGIMITGSHNPPEYNGMKICVGKETIYGEEIQKLYKIVKSLPPKIENKNGQLSHFDILSKYKKFLLTEFKVIDNIASSISIAVDSGNGCAGIFVPQVLKELGIKVFELYSEPDGNFPNHHPDPTLIETLSTLQDTVKNNNLDFGIAYDGDVDRLGVVDERGNVVYGDKLTYIFAKDILKTHLKGKIIGEVKCSKTIFDGIRELGGEPILSPVGHSLIKKKMKESGALLAGEMSGHIFFNDRYFGYDDAIYATLRLIEIFAKEKSKNNNFKFSDLLKDLPETYVSPEIRVDCKEEEKFALVEQFLVKYKEKFPNLADKIKNVITIDGVRIEFPDGWGLIRASNTQPVLVMRFEAETLEALEEYEQSFKITLGGDK